MIIFCLLSCYLITTVVSIQSWPEDNFYYASVVEYNPVNGKDGNDTLFKNADEYVRLIGIAAKTADIIVFPELGLNYLDFSVYLEIPFGNESSANNSTLHPALMKISKAARDNKVYVAINLHEKYKSESGEVFRYNTNAVFDRKGTIVARYRKYNLYGENYLNITKVPEVVFFDSDFGVRFGMFICFDIFFKEPALTLVYEKNVTDIIYPSWWFSELPSLTSMQIHFAWAYMTDTNVLSAGVNTLATGSTGSGIYAGRKGPLIYVFSEHDETRILSAKVYKKGKHGDLLWSKSELQKDPLHDSNLEFTTEDLSLYDTHLLTSVDVNDKNRGITGDFISTQTLNKTICQGTLCCEFNVDMTFTYRPENKLNMSDPSYIKEDSFYHYQYRLAVRDGIKDFPDGTLLGIQVCSIMPCLNSSLSSCGRKSGNTLPLMVETSKYGKLFLYSTSFNSISIKAVSKNHTDFTFPNILESSNSKSLKAFGSVPDVSRINFNIDNGTSSLHFSSDRLAFASIYSRIISRDGMRNAKSSSVKYVPCKFLTFSMALSLIIYLKKIYDI